MWDEILIYVYVSIIYIYGGVCVFVCPWIYGYMSMHHKGLGREATHIFTYLFEIFEIGCIR